MLGSSWSLYKPFDREYFCILFVSVSLIKCAIYDNESIVYFIFLADECAANH